jgi:gliding motility-associated lipoprotein GldD
MINKLSVGLTLYALILLLSCGNEQLPKPTGYFRIDLPEKTYQEIADSIPFPFSFELPQYGALNLKRTKEQPNFFNVDFSKYGARIHFSYFPVDNNISKLLEESRSLSYKHTEKAQEINEELIINEANRVFGTYYSIEGNAASSDQFFITDSSNHFLRGALYFNVAPNPDSIRPVGEFIKKDIIHLVETFRWKNQTTSPDE